MRKNDFKHLILVGIAAGLSLGVQSLKAVDKDNSRTIFPSLEKHACGNHGDNICNHRNYNKKFQLIK